MKIRYYGTSLCYPSPTHPHPVGGCERCVFGL